MVDQKPQTTTFQSKSTRYWQLSYHPTETKKSDFLDSSDEESDANNQEEKKDVPRRPVPPDDDDDFDEPIVNLSKPLGGGNQTKSTHFNPSH